MGAGVLERETMVVSRALPGPFGPFAADPSRASIIWRNIQRVTGATPIRPERRSASGRLVVISGWSCECRTLPFGGRQIFSVLLPGDLIDVARRDRADTLAFTAITPVELADADLLFGADPDGDPAVVEALRVAAELLDIRLLDHMVRLGRLSGRERVLHLLLELRDRLEGVGLVRDGRFRLPLTQELFADMLGLSVVHINRVLKQLRRSGRITVANGLVTLHDGAKLAAAAFYESAPLSGATGRGGG